MPLQSFEQEVGTAIAGMATAEKRQDRVPDGSVEGFIGWSWKLPGGGDILAENGMTTIISVLNRTIAGRGTTTCKGGGTSNPRIAWGRVAEQKWEG